jgi:CelD/BcsL family acetyltransferase involved in cellulose biosynthesis
MEELETVYGSTYTTLRYFRLFKPPPPWFTCVLDNPRHIVVFGMKGGTALVLNSVLAIEADNVDRVARALFAACPRIQRVVFEMVATDPDNIRLPTRKWRTSEDIVINLPTVVDDYLNSLGRRTRQGLRRDGRHLKNAMPGVRFEVVVDAEVTGELVRKVVGLNRLRMAAKGRVSGIDQLYETRLGQLVREAGFAGILKMNDDLLAGTLCTRVGKDVFLHAIAHDPVYDSLRLGLLCLNATIEAAIGMGVQRFHCMWGRSEYKERMGGVLVPLYCLSLYRSKSLRTLYLAEAARGWIEQRGFMPLRSLPARAWRRLCRRLGRGPDAG